MHRIYYQNWQRYWQRSSFRVQTRHSSSGKNYQNDFWRKCRWTTWNDSGYIPSSVCAVWWRREQKTAEPRHEWCRCLRHLHEHRYICLLSDCAFLLLKLSNNMDMILCNATWFILHRRQTLCSRPVPAFFGIIWHDSSKGNYNINYIYYIVS